MDLEQIRQQIDAVDDEILSLFQKRMEIVGAVAQYKREKGLPVPRPHQNGGALSHQRRHGQRRGAGGLCPHPVFHSL